MSTPNPAEDRTSPSAAECQSCGRYIGPVLTCPYCGAATDTRIPLRVLRWAALLLGVGGLIIFYALAWGSQLPLSSVSDLKPSMQHARVRVRGQVVTTPRVVKQEGAASQVTFDVDDGTGRITVTATRSAAVGLSVADRIPAKGSLVMATGTLNARPGRRIRLYIDGASSLLIEKAAASSPETPSMPKPDIPETEDQQRDPS